VRILNSQIKLHHFRKDEKYSEEERMKKMRSALFKNFLVEINETIRRGKEIVRGRN
jgi:hypothetical protein